MCPYINIRVDYSMFLGKNGVYGFDVRIIVIYDICETSVSDYVVSENLITQPVTVIILIDEVYLFNGELGNYHFDTVLSFEEKAGLSIFDEKLIYRQPLPTKLLLNSTT
jgi:hypothetical protein